MFELADTSALQCQADGRLSRVEREQQGRVKTMTDPCNGDCDLRPTGTAVEILPPKYEWECIYCHRQELRPEPGENPVSRIPAPWSINHDGHTINCPDEFDLEPVDLNHSRNRDDLVRWLGHEVERERAIAAEQKKKREQRARDRYEA